MQILAIETTGPVCSVALLREDNSIKELMGKDRMNHLKSLTPMIAQLMREEEITWQNIDRIAVSVGPGSFTGIRIGVATGRALSQMTGIPLVAVETLAAFGLGEYRKLIEKPGEQASHGAKKVATMNNNVVVCPIFDARRRQVYGGAYGENQELVSGKPYMLDEFLEQLEKLTSAKVFYFVGDGLGTYQEAVCQWAEKQGNRLTCGKVVQRAGYVAQFAKGMMEPGDGHSDAQITLSYNQLEPRYMRQAEAQRQLEKKQAAAKEQAKEQAGNYREKKGATAGE